MIVRNVVLSSEPRALKPLVGIAQELPEQQRGSIPDAAKEQLQQSASWPNNPALQIETAAQWLAMQSTGMRAALARELVDDLESLRARSRAEGFEAGHAEGQRAVAEQTQSILASLARVVSAAEEAFVHEAAQLAHGCAEIVAAAFCKIAGDRLVSREAALAAVLEVLKHVKDERELTIRVSGHDLPLLQEHEALLREALGSRRWKLIADPRVVAGGCLVESSLGTLDGRLEVQLHELGETLRAAKSNEWGAHERT